MTDPSDLTPPAPAGVANHPRGQSWTDKHLPILKPFAARFGKLFTWGNACSLLQAYRRGERRFFVWLGRLLFNWRNLRRALLATATAVTLVSSFYVVENWRGQRNWEVTLENLRAGGEELDYDKFTARRVPDGENMLKAPMMEEWFVQKKVPTQGWLDFNALYQQAVNYGKGGKNGIFKPVFLGTVSFQLETDSSSDKMTSAWPGKDGETARFGLHPDLRLLSFRPQNQGFVDHQTFTHLSSHRHDRLPKVELVFRVRTIPTREEVETVLGKISGPYVLGVEATANPLSFGLRLKRFHCLAADDILAEFNKHQADYELIREAARRPYSYLENDFIKLDYDGMRLDFNMAARAAILGMVIKSSLLKRQPAEAVSTVELLQAFRKINRSMIGTHLGAALDGFYANFIWDSVRDGINLHAWGERELIFLQNETLKENHVAATLHATRSERALIIKRIETHGCQALMDAGADADSMKWWEKLQHRAYPEGWFSKGPLSLIKIPQPHIEANEARLARLNGETPEPKPALAQMEIPEFGKGYAENLKGLFAEASACQTRADLALLACGLERHRLATGNYPETLAELTPRFAPKQPFQFHSAKPYHYRREADGGFSLWSAGSDLVDDGGRFTPGETFPTTNKDWGWRILPPR